MNNIVFINSGHRQVGSLIYSWMWAHGWRQVLTASARIKSCFAATPLT